MWVLEVLELFDSGYVCCVILVQHDYCSEDVKRGCGRQGFRLLNLTFEVYIDLIVSVRRHQHQPQFLASDATEKSLKSLFTPHSP